VVSTRVGIVILLGLVGALHIATLRSGHGWGDDFAMYIHHAKNLAEGLPYAATGYIYNPHNLAIGPTVYPPGFPLLLAPVYKVFGLDLQAMRVELVALLVACLALTAWLFWSELPPLAVAIVIGVIGVNPSIWSLLDQVLSDIPFLVFCLAAIGLLRHVEQESSRGGGLTSARATFNTFLLGLCVLSRDRNQNGRCDPSGLRDLE
jgi:4-amino-4-deoxy-L-arabinose transferase-like glycosyltransferase